MALSHLSSLAARAALAALPLAIATPPIAAHGRVTPLIAARGFAAIGQSQVVQGFAVTPRAIVRAREAGAADYAAARGAVFLLVDVRIQRAGGHGSYYADPRDFVVETSRGAIIDSESFGMAGEFKPRHVYSAPLTGWIGFEVPAADRGLRLLWEPAFGDNPDAQATWSIGRGATVQYYR